jgi:hypothetical protein
VVWSCSGRGVRPKNVRAELSRVKTRVLGREGWSEGETSAMAALVAVVVGVVRKGCHVARFEMARLSLQVSQDDTFAAPNKQC